MYHCGPDDTVIDTHNRRIVMSDEGVNPRQVMERKFWYYDLGHDINHSTVMRKNYI